MSFVAYIKNSSGHAEESRESGVGSLEVWVKTQPTRVPDSGLLTPDSHAHRHRR